MSSSVSTGFIARILPTKASVTRLIGRTCYRMVSGMLVILVAATLTFFALHFTPGDPITAILGGPTANPTPQAIAAAIHEYGLDQPLGRQYYIYMRRIVSGDLGQSFSQHMPVIDVIRTQSLPTLELTLVAMTIAWLLAVVSTCLTAGVARGGRIMSVVETVWSGLPPFWLGLILLSVLAFKAHLLPPAGSDSVAALIMPALAMAIPLAGFMAKIAREAFVVALQQPFILSARMRGATEWRVRTRHALRHAVVPCVNLSTWAFGAMIGNAVAIEMIFSRKGIGRELFLAVSYHDMPLTAGIVMFIALFYVLASIVADAVVQIVDPRSNGVSS